MLFQNEKQRCSVGGYRHRMLHTSELQYKIGLDFARLIEPTLNGEEIGLSQTITGLIITMNYVCVRTSDLNCETIYSSALCATVNKHSRVY